jgi:4-amino-4-deoxy-L-arabinose transferase-like glycosyltransferase
LQLVRRFRLPALLCALAVLFCELISRPFVEMGISDDTPYVLMARTLAITGHIAYNGWATAMLGWQLYIGAAFIKLFGFSFTSVRMSTLLVSLATVLLLQRIFVRAGISERNAALATLVLALSPLYLLLSVTYMSDIFGLFAIVICLYGCLRALQSVTPNTTIFWLCFAVVTNGLFGTARQIAWLGILVMVPSTLWLLRAQRRALIAGSAATFAGALFIFACMQWFKHQPYSVPEKIFGPSFPIAGTLWSLTYFVLAIPFLLLPIIALFLPSLRKTSPKILAVLGILLLGYLFLAIYPSHLRGHFPLEPTMSGGGNWIGVHGTHEGHHLQGDPPRFLNVPAQALITIVSFGGLFALLVSLRRPRRTSSTPQSATDLSWKQLAILLVPYACAYICLLIPRSGTGWIYDRYTLEIGLVALIFLVRYYQEQIQPQIPPADIVLIAIMAVIGVAITHNHFSLYRARVVLANELLAAGIPDTSVDNGFEYNFAVELRRVGHINEEAIVVPSHASVPEPPLPAGTCKMFWHQKTPHITPLYGISFDPTACYGPAPFAPVHYTRWLASSPETLYVVRYTPRAKP